MIKIGGLTAKISRHVTINAFHRRELPPGLRSIPWILSIIMNTIDYSRGETTLGLSSRPPYGSDNVQYHECWAPWHYEHDRPPYWPVLVVYNCLDFVKNNFHNKKKFKSVPLCVNYLRVEPSFCMTVNSSQPQTIFSNSKHSRNHEILLPLRK